MKTPSWFICLSALLCCFLPADSFAQGTKKVKLVRSSDWVYDKAYIDANRYRGNVLIDYEGTLFYCDSVHIFPTENFNAYGSIRITKGADYTLTGKRLTFDRATSTAMVYDDVVLRDSDMTLTTQRLSYNTGTQIATYFNKGRIVSRKNNNVLTSDQGVYNSPLSLFYFRKQVVLKNVNYTMTSDTLHYHNATEVAYFFGPTHIQGKNDRLYCENGWYDTKKDRGRFRKNAIIYSGTQTLWGDSVHYEGEKGMGEAFGNVSIQDTTEQIIITGQYGHYNRLLARSFVTDEALLIQFDEMGDSLFMHADTLMSIEDTVAKVRTLLGYHRVRIFRTDLQGVCDSVVMQSTDSIVRFFSDPVFWSGQNQISGDSIAVYTGKKGVERMVVEGNCFIASQADSVHFNQIKGRRLTGTFYENDLRTVYVEGNGQLIYYPENDQRPGAPIGLNNGECSNIHIELRDKSIQRIRLETEANSVLHPLKDAPDEDKLLEGFQWRIHERPVSKQDLLAPAVSSIK
jgi:lipopolysaccharide export system protein LptA